MGVGKAMARVVALGIVLGIAIGLVLFYRELEPPITIKPSIDLVYLYVRIDRVSPNISGFHGRDLYVVSYVAVINVSNSYNYTVVPYSVELTFVENTSRSTVNIEIVDGRRGNASRISTVKGYVTWFGVDTFWIPQHVVDCWLCPRSYKLYVLKTTKIVSRYTVEHLIKALSDSVTVVIHFNAKPLDRRGCADVGMEKNIRLTRISNNEYLYNALPKGIEFVDVELCGAMIAKHS